MVAVTRDLMRRVVARTGYPGLEAWSSHNKGAMSDLLGATVHHTGSAWNPAVDYRTLKIVRDGRAGLENSLSMFGLGLSGTIYLISPNVSWHAGEWELGGNRDGNGKLAGIEAESDGRNWTAAQRDCYPRLVASIILESRTKDRRYTGRHADGCVPRGRKTDAGGLDLTDFWTTVDFYLANPEYIHKDYKGPSLIKEMDMRDLIIAKDIGGTYWVGNGIQRRRVPEASLAGLQYWVGLKGGDPKFYDFADLSVLGVDIDSPAKETSVGFIRDQILTALGIGPNRHLERSEAPFVTKVMGS